MATLLHHIALMQKSIPEAELRTENWVTKLAEIQIQAVHKCLHVLELRVLALPSPTTDLNDIRIELPVFKLT